MAYGPQLTFLSRKRPAWGSWQPRCLGGGKVDFVAGSETQRVYVWWHAQHWSTSWFCVLFILRVRPLTVLSAGAQKNRGHAERGGRVERSEPQVASRLGARVEASRSELSKRRKRSERGQCCVDWQALCIELGTVYLPIESKIAPASSPNTGEGKQLSFSE